MAGILRTAGLNVEIHDDHFAQDAKDEEWLMIAGNKQWIVVTRDERIRYRAAAKQVIRRSKVRMFVLVVHGNLRIEMLAEIFVKALPKIRVIAAQERHRLSPRFGATGMLR